MCTRTKIAKTQRRCVGDDQSDPVLVERPVYFHFALEITNYRPARPFGSIRLAKFG